MASLNKLEKGRCRSVTATRDARIAEFAKHFNAVLKAKPSHVNLTATGNLMWRNIQPEVRFRIYPFLSF